MQGVYVQGVCIVQGVYVSAHIAAALIALEPLHRDACRRYRVQTCRLLGLVVNIWPWNPSAVQKSQPCLVIEPQTKCLIDSCSTAYCHALSDLHSTARVREIRKYDGRRPSLRLGPLATVSGASTRRRAHAEQSVFGHQTPLTRRYFGLRSAQ